MVVRKSMLICLIALLIFLSSFSVQAKGDVLELGVEDAVELAFQGNLNFQIAALDWQGAEAQMERAQIVGDEDMLKEAKKEWEKAHELYTEKRNQLREQIRTSYQQLLKSEASVEHAKVAKERAASQLAMDENKYKAGLLSTLDIERAQNSLLDAEYRLERAMLDLETKRMQFNSELGLPLDQQVSLTERLLLDFVPFEFSLEECYERALQLDPGVLRAKEALQKSKDAVVLARSPFTPRVELEEAMVREEKAAIELRQAEQTLYFTIRGDFLALQNQVHNLEMAERTIKLEQQALKAEESKYAAGVLSNAQIVAQQEKLASLEEQYSDDLSLYTEARIKLLQVIGAYAEPGENHDD